MYVCTILMKMTFFWSHCIEKWIGGEYNLTAHIGECCNLVLLGKEGVGIGCQRVIPTDLILVINSV